MALAFRPKRRGIIFLIVLTVVVGLTSVVSYAATAKGNATTAEPVLANSSDVVRGASHVHDRGGRSAAAYTPRRQCNPIPPEYPSCSKDQVRALARNNTEDWWRHRRFGSTNNVLNATDLTNAQVDKVMQATRENLKAILNKNASKAVAQGRVAGKAAWTTSWRQNTYTLESFPYVAWTHQMFEGCEGQGGVCPGNLDACFDAVGNTTNGWAYLECTATGVPNSWDNFWKPYWEWVNDGGPQGDTICKREMFVGAVVGAVGTGSKAIFAGPGAVLGAALGGAASGTLGGLAFCAANGLADQWDWPE